jgi:hypothetical protein
MMNITWHIESLIVNPQIGNSADVVVAANWRVWAEQDGVRGTTHGSVNFPPPQGDKFTTYANLTEKMILQWVWEIGASDDIDLPWSKAIAEQKAIDAVQMQLAAITEKPLPWMPSPAPVEPQPSIDERLQAAETLINLILDEGAI